MTAEEGKALACQLASLPEEGANILRRLDTMVYSRLREALSVNVPPDIERHLASFSGAYGQFRDYVQYGVLSGKCVVALGGASGSGKTSAVNALLGIGALPPSDGGPAPLPPCYVVHGQAEECFAINVFGAHLALAPHDLHRAAQAFDAPLTHLLRSACLVSPRLRYRSLTLLDLPGFAKPGAAVRARRPEDILRHLNAADAVFWCVDACSEKIGEEDLRLLKALRADIPKVILLTRADLCPAETLRARKEAVRAALDLRAVSCEAVCACSAHEMRGFDSDEIRAFLAQWNRMAYRDRFTERFQALFARCGSYYEELLSDDRRRLELLKALPAETAYRAQWLELERGLKRRILTATGARGQINTLRDNFFAEYERISAAAGLVRPAAEEVPHREQEPMAWMQAYRKAEGITYDPGIAAALRAIPPASSFDTAAGGALFRFRMSDTLRCHCPKQEEERLTDGIRGKMCDTLRRMRLALCEEPAFLTQMSVPVAAEVLDAASEAAQTEDEPGFRSFTEVAEVVHSAKVSGVAVETDLAAPGRYTIQRDGILSREIGGEAE